MDGEADAKIRSTALRYIGRHTMSPPAWRHTLLGDAHREVLSRAELEPGELPLVSFFLSPASWYLLGTRRVVGSYAGKDVKAAALDVLEEPTTDCRRHRCCWEQGRLR